MTVAGRIVRVRCADMLLPFVPSALFLALASHGCVPKLSSEDSEQRSVCGINLFVRAKVQQAHCAISDEQRENAR
jgi:hypothetical protein